MRQPVEVLIEKYKNNIYVIAFNVCKNAQDAEDVVQDTFIQYISVTHSHHLARRLEVGASRSMRLTAQVSTS